MSAITGLLRPEHHPIEVAHLQQMTEILSHRGPDGTDLWCNGPIGLGHCLLQTTPESLLEHLPLTNPSQTLTLTADARIDNRADLIQVLSLQAYPPETITDSALILAAYEQWGEKCPEHLIGDFAFAIWDTVQQHLFCARDHLGVKPFFYYGSDTVFAFASEIKALFCTPDIPRKLNETRVADFLTMMLFDPKMTIYRQIFRLPAAHSMIVSNQNIQISSYWSLDPDYELQLESDQAYADRFREIFTEAVRCRLRSAFPVGTLLSGGIDSSSITCTAVQLKQQSQDQTKLPTFSAVFNEITASDEQKYINAVIDEGGIDPHYVQGDQLGPWTDHQQVIAEQDEPLFACNLHLTRALYKTAQQKSVRVLLDGFDGDQTVSHGVGYLKTLAKTGRWLKLFQEMQGFCRNYDHAFLPLYRSYLYKFGLEPILKQTKILKLTRKLKQLKSTLLPTPPAPSSGQAMPWSMPLNPEFVDQLDLLKRYQQLRRQRFGAQPTQRHSHIADVTSGLISSTLEVMDRTAAACQLELRYPFWDKRLVEFCVSLPEAQKMQQGWTRLIIRRGMTGVLPPFIQWRCSKGNLGTAFDHTLYNYESTLIREALFNPPNQMPEFIDTVALENIYEKFAEGQMSNSDNTLLIWQAVNLSLWLQQTEIERPFANEFTKD